MAEIDKSRTLEFDRRSSGLAIKIPITEATAEWSAAVNQFAHEQHVDVRVTRDGEHLLLYLTPGTNRDGVVRRLNWCTTSGASEPDGTRRPGRHCSP